MTSDEPSSEGFEVERGDVGDSIGALAATG
jgi:hypothetical protein